MAKIDLGDAPTPAVNTSESRRSNSEYTVGWICAITTEYVAAQVFLDEKHDGPEEVSFNDNNDYTLGRIGKHNTVIAVLPDGEYGTSSAARVAKVMLLSFPNVRVGLMVGIGGGAPSQMHDVRLGDVVVSAPRDGKGGVFQYDFGKRLQGQELQPTLFLDQPPEILRTAVSGMKAKYKIEGHQLEESIHAVLKKNPRLQLEYKRPDSSTDRLFEAKITHDSACAAACSESASNLILRPERTELDDNPAIHYGLIASANQLMKDALVRDKLAADNGVLCFEMEAAGLMNHFPCLVVRGICDYSDSHKNMIWQGYAAMTAAAYTRDLLYRLPQNKVETQKRICDILHGIQEGVGRLFHEQRQVQHNQEHGKLLKWLTPIDYAYRQKDYISMRQPGTGQWFLDSKEYQAWRETNQQTLFCPGDPGAGKTIITAITIDDLYTRFNCDNTVGIAYLYCDYSRQYEQKVEDLLANLLKQLVQKQIAIPDGVQALYDDYQGRPKRPSVDEFSKALRSVSIVYSKVFIIVDALDECQEMDGCLMRLVSEIFKLQTDCGVNIFATSRYIPSILKRFNKCVSLRVNARDDDVQIYLAGQMARLPPFVQRNPNLQHIIKHTVSRAVDGMFLLARLHIDSISKLPTVGDIKRALQHLPKGLSNTYEHTMTRIKSQGETAQKLAIKVLSWLIHAKRMLSTCELQHAVAVELRKAELDREFIPDLEIIVAICAGLAVIDIQSDTIRLAHYTTKEYFKGEGKHWFLNTEGNILAACITYLSFPVFEGFCLSQKGFEERLCFYPLYDYAARNWGYHVVEGKIPNEVVISFLQSTSKVEAASQALLAAQDTSEEDDSQQVPRKVTGLHLAGFFGLIGAADALLRLEPSPILKDSLGRTPLWYAACEGQDAVAELLLEATADIASVAAPKQGLTTLQAAARGGHLKIVEKLLHAGAKVDAVCACSYSTYNALQEAAKGGYLEVVEILLEAGADVNIAAFLFNSTALQEAAKGGYLDIVERLLEAGADVNAAPAKQAGGTALQGAAEGGYTEVVRRLLEAGGKDSPCPYGHTALQAAARRGDLEVVKMLLDAGADVNTAASAYGRTALQEAAGNGHLAIIEMLLEAGSNVNAAAAEEYGHTALQAAAKDGHLDVIEKLLEAGADINAATSTRGCTALQAAAENGHLDIIETLLEAGADVNAATSIFGLTAVQKAAEHGHLNVIEKLLEAGADINAAASTHGRTGLQAAAGNGHLATIEMLLEAGANVNAAAAQQDGRTALQAAAENGHLDVIDKLLEAKADVNATAAIGEGRTALQAAAEGGHLKAVEKLIEAKANVNIAASNFIPTALQAAAKGGYLQIVEILLEAKANVNGVAAGIFGLTALQEAARGGYLEIVEKLLEVGANVNAAAMEDGYTALQGAAAGGYINVVEKLIEKGANLNATGGEIYRTALQEAAKEGHIEVVDKLLAAGADVNASADISPFERTALQVAARRGDLGMVEKFLKAGANVDAISPYRGPTALQEAAREGSLEVVEKLLEAGANVNAAASRYGETALQAAANESHIDVVEGLLEAGANADASCCR